MTSIDADIITYLKQLNPTLQIFDEDHVQEWGVLVQQRGDSVPDVLLNFETATVDITVREQGQGERGTARSLCTAQKLFSQVRLVFDKTINGVEYCRMYATASPTKVASGQGWSAYRITISIERSIGGITWQ